MGSMQIVFLFDLNACGDFLSKPKEELSKKLLSVRLACLRVLTDLSSKSPNFKWGFKFFDSHGSKIQSMQTFSFSDLTLESFETLENEIIVRYERHLSLIQALAESSQKTEVSAKKEQNGEITSEPPVKILQLAITQILCEYQWETMDMWSPSIAKLRSRTFGRINFLFVFSEFKDDDAFLYEYFKLNSSISKPKFLNAFLPQSLRDSIVKKSDIHLVLLNTCLEQKFMGSPKSKLLPLLSHSLQAVQGSLIPLSILSQPSCNLKLPEKLAAEDNSFIPALCNSYRNSLIPFSILFEQSLNRSFYSSMNTSVYDCCIEFPNKDESIQIQVAEVFKKNTSICKDGNSTRVLGCKKKSSSEEKSVVWSKFIVHFSLSRNCHFPAKEMFVCLANNSKPGVGSLTSLNKNLYMEEINLVVECVPESGPKMLGMLTPLSYDCAVILILDPSVKFSQLEFESKMTVSSSTTDGSQVNYLSNEMKDIKNFQKIEPGNSSNCCFKTFQVEYLEPWFKPTADTSKATVETAPSNSKLKMESYWQLLKQSVQHSKNSKLKRLKVKQNSIKGAITNSENKEISEKSEGDQFNENQTKDIDDKLLDLGYEELLSAVRDIYNSAIESSSDIVYPSNRIVKIIVNYCKKQCVSSSELEPSNILKDNLLMTARKIIEKYENDDSQQATENKIKECQMQVLLILGIENLKACPDRSNCVNNVTSLLRLMIFYNGVKESQNFLHEVLQKSFGNNLYDILVEIGDELDIPIFDDADSSNSPAETISSEFNNDDDIFSSVVSSNISEKSSSSTNSRKGKENKDNVVERKLARHRSDISDTSRHRQVLLPRSSKKKKVKAAANKALRYSPRLAAKKNEQGKSVCEKTNKVCRNLFSIDKVQCTPKKNVPSTPKRNKVGNCSSNVLYVPSTPFEKQNHSALQRKIFNDQSSNSPKIYISPKINKTAKDGTSRELMEKLERVALERRASNNNIKTNTPESNRRLSLKLHSKHFSSPTARLGIKKCMKRLFDQVSPGKNNESNKRHKPDEECNVSSPSKKDIS